ncbi:MAG: energy-coupling factor transporter transmembrane component T [Infirmifilum sp.]
MEALRAFKFIKKNSVIDGLDPRTRFAVTLTIAALSLLSIDVKSQLVLLLTGFFLAWVGKRVGLLLNGLKNIIPLGVMIFILNWITAPSEGLLPPLAMTLRFLVLTSIFSFFFLTTPPDDLALALEEMHLPRDYSLLITMSFRFVPTLAQDVQIVLDALRSRGLELEKGSMAKRIKNYVFLMVPLIVFEVRRSLMIAEALESRGFGASITPSRMYKLSFTRKDFVAGILLSLYVLLFLLLFR